MNIEPITFTHRFQSGKVVSIRFDIDADFNISSEFIRDDIDGDITAEETAELKTWAEECGSKAEYVVLKALMNSQLPHITGPKDDSILDRLN